MGQNTQFNPQPYQNNQGNQNNQNPGNNRGYTTLISSAWMFEGQKICPVCYHTGHRGIDCPHYAERTDFTPWPSVPTPEIMEKVRQIYYGSQQPRNNMNRIASSTPEFNLALQLPTVQNTVDVTKVRPHDQMRSPCKDQAVLH